MKSQTNYSTKFYPEKRKKDGNLITDNVPIFVSITYKANRLFYYTGQRCDLLSWDPPSQRLKTDPKPQNMKEVKETNSHLTKIDDAITILFDAYGRDEIIPDIKRLRNDLRNKLSKGDTEKIKLSFFDHYRNYIDRLDLSPGRIKKHNTTFNKVMSFNSNTSFDVINSDYLEGFQSYLRKRGGKVKQTLNGKPVMLNGKPTYKPGPLAKNTVISELKRFKAFINWAFKKKLIKTIPFLDFKIDSESYGDPIFITTEERDILFDAIIEDERLSRVRDMFVLQCYLGCRVGDFIQLKRSNIIDGSIEYIAAKTRKNTVRIARIPIAKKAWEIINKYDLPGGDLVPYISDQKYNVYLKELFKLLKINRIVTIADPKTRLDKQVPICELASSHMARRVFVGSLYKKGVKNEIIASMSGHAEGSKAFSRYHNIDREQQQEAIKLIE